MAVTNYTRVFSTGCNGELISFINADSNITPMLLQIINDSTGSPTVSEFWFDSPMSGSEIIVFDNLLLSWVCPAPVSDPSDVTLPNVSITNPPPIGSGLEWNGTEWASTISNVCIRSNGNISQTISNNYVNINIGTNIRTDSGYTISNNIITVLNSGWYQVAYDIGVTMSGINNSGNAFAISLLRLDGNIIRGSAAYSRLSSAAPSATLIGSRYTYIGGGQTLELLIRDNNGTLVTLPESSDILITQKY